MKKLLKQYGFNSDMQYFEMIAESVINGQISQAKELFNAMRKPDKKAFIKAIYGNWQSGISNEVKNIFIELV